MKVFFLICFYIYGIFIKWYRPYIYEHNIFDFGIADIGINLFFVPSVSLLYSLFKKDICTKPQFIQLVKYNFIALTSVELLSGVFPFLGHFDIMDIIGLSIGAILANKMSYYFEED
jgi:hypothetical protein